MSNKAYPFMFCHNFKVILDIRKTRKKKKREFLEAKGIFTCIFYCHQHSHISIIFKQKASLFNLLS